MSWSAEWRALPQEIRDKIRTAQADAPVGLGGLARNLHLEVKAATLKPGVSGEIRRVEPDTYQVKVNRHDPKNRQRFTVAHEISHFLLHRDRIGDGIVDDKLYRSTLSNLREQEANRLAADILMPPDLVQHTIERFADLPTEAKLQAVANALQVSEAALSVRLDVLRLNIHGA